MLFLIFLIYFFDKLLNNRLLSRNLLYLLQSEVEATVVLERLQQ